jgi:hypothetical protein
MGGQRLVEAGPATEVVHDRQGADALAVKLEAAGGSGRLNHEP